MIPECDEIIALDDGMVVKQRNHQELFKSNAGTPNCSQHESSNWTRRCGGVSMKSVVSLAQPVSTLFESVLFGKDHETNASASSVLCGLRFVL
jgi:hypothetical protein